MFEIFVLYYFYSTTLQRKLYNMYKAVFKEWTPVFPFFAKIKELAKQLIYVAEPFFFFFFPLH